MFEEIEKLKLEEKISIYRKLVEISVKKEFPNNDLYIIGNLRLNSNDIIEITRYAILIYGNYKEIQKYYKKFGLTTISKDVNQLDKMKNDKAKYIYYFNKQYGSDKKECQKLAKNLGITLIDIKLISKDYAVSYLKTPKQEYDWENYVRGMKNNNEIKARMSYITLFDLLLKFEDKKDIIDIIEYSNVEMNKIRRELEMHLDTYMRTKNLTDETTKQELQEKLSIYYNEEKRRKQVEQKEKEAKQKTTKIGKAIITVTKCINSDYPAISNIDFANHLQITKESLNRYISIVQRTNPELYKEYKAKIEANAKAKIEEKQEIGKIVAHYLKYGVETEQGLRKFDLIDYYALTEYNIKEICSVSSNVIPREEYIEMAKLRVTNTTLKNHQIVTSRLFVGDIEVGCQKDSQGLPIKGTGRKITQQDFDEIKKVYKKYNIPKELYKVALERIKNGIDLEDIALTRNDIEKKKKRHKSFR